MTEENDYYLAHPFDSRHEMRQWELDFEKRTGIMLLNPFYDAKGRTDIEKIDAGRSERYENLNPIELVERDVRNINGCKNGMIADMVASREWISFVPGINSDETKLRQYNPETIRTIIKTILERK